MVHLYMKLWYCDTCVCCTENVHALHVYVVYTVVSVTIVAKRTFDAVLTRSASMARMRNITTITTVTINICSAVVNNYSCGYIFASKLATSIHQGLNVTHLSVLVCCNILHQYQYTFSRPFGIGLIYNGRIKGGHLSQRFVMNALCG